VDEETKRHHLRRCRAFLFPAEEDFGIAPVEALASGRPVVAYAAGGALDVINEEKTGLLFREQTVEALAEQLRAVPSYDWDGRAIAAHAARFDTQTFKSRLVTFVKEKAAGHARERARVRVK
jgi:glycosyltransferase involved in cell wall biosynthesis